MTRNKSLKRPQLRRNVKPDKTTRRAEGNTAMQLRLVETGISDMPPGVAPASYRLALKALRNRAQLSLSECGKATDLSPTGYQRYENEKVYDSTPIPFRVIRGLIAVMVGKGNPPIEEHELINISELRDTARQSAANQPGQMFEQSDFSTDKSPRLPVRYVVERGSYRSAGLSQPVYGMSSLGMSPAWDQGRQWAARVIGPDATNFRFQHGTLLHCVDPEIVTGDSLTENRIVVAARRRDDLLEILLARIVSMTGPRTARLRDSDGTEFSGDVLGVVQFHYSKAD